MYTSDRQCIQQSDAWITDAVINAAQRILKACFPEVDGLQSTTHGFKLSYNIVTSPFVQILHMNDNHWVTVANINCSNEITVYGSMNLGYLSKEVKQQIAAMFFSSEKEIILNFAQLNPQKGHSVWIVLCCLCNLTLCWR